MKELCDFIGGQNCVTAESFQSYCNLESDVLVERLNEIQHRGYIEMSRSSTNKVVIEMTDDGKTVCGFVMSTLVRFYDSQR